MTRLGLITASALALAGMAAWWSGGLPALLGVLVGVVASFVPTAIPVWALKQGQSLVNPTMLAMTIRMLLAGAIVLGVLVAFGRPVVQPFAFGLVASYIITLVAETVFFAQALAGVDKTRSAPLGETPTVTA